jgi:predicted RNA-binding Zn-ribbon protein involved in translation (DUF1610 family)
VSEQGLVQADCPTCGEVVAPASTLVCGVSGADENALCEFSCPRCDRALLHSLSSIEVNTLLLLGARHGTSLPFEILEAHSGPAISWDDILDLHFELVYQSFPQRGLVQGRAA